MSIRIERATAKDLPAIRLLNQRLRERSTEFLLPESPELMDSPPSGSAPIWWEFYVAKDSEAVRGAYLLKREPLRIGPSSTDVWNYQLPISEGIVDKAYSMVGIQLLQDAIKRSERLYCLGMGDLSRPLPRLLLRFHWTLESVPFFFRVIRSSGFLRNISYLNSHRKGAALIPVARYSGLGALMTTAWTLTSRIRQPRLPRHLTVETVPIFGSEVDALFSEVQESYGALVVRTARTMNLRYPTDDSRLIRLVARSAGRPIGWVVLTRSDLHGHKQFGSMRLGCIVDGCCNPDLSAVMVRIATERLIAEGVDLIVSNQTHSAWIHALRKCGFASGPSNFIFARSPALTDCSPGLGDWHINRGDGDGPIHL